VATGVAAGTADITYQLATGCKDADVLTINLQPAAISGMASTCVDGTVTLSDATDDGTWYSGNTAVATVGSSSGVVSGIATGTAPITYTTAAGCRATQEVTVMAQPVIGAPQVCEGQTTALSCAISGGSWSSSDVAMVTVDAATGMALGIGAGNPVISYTTSFGCQAAATITVNVTPPAISGAPGVCNGGVTTFSNSLAGGSWACADATVGSIDGATGIFTTVGIGTTTITYATSTGCSAVKPVSVNAVAPLTGNNRLCITYTTTLSSALAGGIWTSGSTDTATVNSLTGVVYGVGPGTAMITYTTAGGCIATSLVKVSNYVYPLETQPLSTPLRTNICLGNTLGLNSPFGGDGHWTTSDITRATVTNLVPGSLAPWGVVSALSLGTVTISYTASNGCVSTHTITINAMPVITSIAPTVCRYGTTTLNATPAAGQWISHNITTAQVTNYWTGVVHASLLGVAEIAYRLFTYDQCGVNILLTVNACTPREDEAGGGNESSVGYAISPNPGAGNFTISQNVAVDGPILVRVVNCLGQAVYNGSVAFVGGSGTLDLLNVAQGIYLVELEGKPGEKKVIRVAVQK
jgi:uncharacterized protein YjdB